MSKNVKRMNFSRMVVFTLSIVIFIAVVGLAFVFSVNDYEADILTDYKRNQALIAEQLRDTLEMKYQLGQTDEEICEYMETLQGTGSRFFALAKDEKMLFVRDMTATSGLGSLVDKTKFDNRINEQGSEVIIEHFEYDGSLYEIELIYDTYAAKTNMKMNKHSYYLYILLALISLVMLALLETTVGMWNNSEKNLRSARDLLIKRNDDVKSLSEELMSGEGDKSDISANVSGTGITELNGVEIYNAYTMRDLMVKSKRRDMGQVHMLIYQFKFQDRYVSKEEIFANIAKLQKVLKHTEILGEIQKGVFVVFGYKMNEEQAVTRFEEIVAEFDEVGKVMGLLSEHKIEIDDGRNMVEVYDSYRGANNYSNVGRW